MEEEEAEEDVEAAGVEVVVVVVEAVEDMMEDTEVETNTEEVQIAEVKHTPAIVTLRMQQKNTETKLKETTIIPFSLEIFLTMLDLKTLKVSLPI